MKPKRVAVGQMPGHDRVFPDAAACSLGAWPESGLSNANNAHDRSFLHGTQTHPAWPGGPLASAYNRQANIIDSLVATLRRNMVGTVLFS